MTFRGWGVKTRDVTRLLTGRGTTASALNANFLPLTAIVILNLMFFRIYKRRFIGTVATLEFEMSALHHRFLWLHIDR